MYRVYTSMVCICCILFVIEIFLYVKSPLGSGKGCSLFGCYVIALMPIWSCFLDGLR